MSVNTGGEKTAHLTILLLLLLLLLGACTSFDPKPFVMDSAGSETITQEKHDITVSTKILSDQQALALFGVDIADVGLQAIWLHIENRSDHSHWLLNSALDANYFPADEAAALFHLRLPEKQEQAVTQHFRKLAIPLKSTPGSVNEGYILAPRHEGGRYVQVMLASSQHIVKFGFAVPLPDGDFDFEQLDPGRIYIDQVLPDLDLDQLREEIRELPCCVTDADGERNGDPLNLVLVGDVSDVLAAMSRAGWSFTHRLSLTTVQRMIGAAFSGAAYPVAPVSPLYFHGPQQDMALQRARSTIIQRNHLRLWLAPYRFEGRSVWVGQISRDIAVKATMLSPTLTTHVIDPNVDEAREHLLQSLLVSGAIDRFAFAQGMPPVPATRPLRNLTDDPYHTDGLRFVVILPRGTIKAPEDARFIEWRNSQDPIKPTGQTPKK